MELHMLMSITIITKTNAGYGIIVTWENEWINNYVQIYKVL